MVVSSVVVDVVVVVVVVGVWRWVHLHTTYTCIVQHARNDRSRAFGESRQREIR